MFNRVYLNNEYGIGFDCAGGTWVRAGLEDDGITINCLYLSSEPALSFKQARKFANKILEMCDLGDKEAER